MAWPSATQAASMLLLSLSLAMLPAARAVAGSRLRQLAGSTSATGALLAARTGLGPAVSGDERAGRARAARWRAIIFSVLAGSAALVTFPSIPGGVAAVLISAGVFVLLRGMDATAGATVAANGWRRALRWPGAINRRAARADPDLPFAIDLVAVCLRAGMPTSAALRSVTAVIPAVGRTGGRVAALPGGLGVPAVLARVAAASELGSEPAAAWQDWIGHPVYGPLARAMVVTGESGSAVAGRLDAVSQQLRTSSGQQAMARAQRTGVLLMAPLGACFLPAFVCLGVVPVVVGIAGQVFR